MSGSENTGTARRPRSLSTGDLPRPQRLFPGEPPTPAPTQPTLEFPGPLNEKDAAEHRRITAPSLDAPAPDRPAERIRSFKRRFGYEPGRGQLADAAEQRRSRRRAYDATRAREELTSWRYLRDRTQILRQLAGDHYLIDQIGQRVAQASLTQGLELDNPASAPYGRSMPSGETGHHLEEMAADAKVEADFFVNSAAALDRIKQFRALPQGADLVPTPLAPGIVAVSITGPDDVRVRLQPDLQKLAASCGASPSPQQVEKYHADAGRRRPAVVDGVEGNNDLILSMTRADSTATAALAELSPAHPCAAVAHTTAQLVDALQTVLAKLGPQARATLDGDILVQDALLHLGDLVAAMAVSLDDSTVVGRLYDLMVDDLFTVLAVAKPFSIDDFAARATEVALQRSCTLADMMGTDGVSARPYLLSSGMEALSAGVGAACLALNAAPGDVQEIGKNYFELGTVVGPQNANATDTARVLRAALHPSGPSVPEGGDAANRWTIAKLVEGVQAALKNKAKPVVLVLDTTVEQAAPDRGEGASEMDAVLSALRDPIRDGELKIVACKSYQKYLSLGSAKVMAGGATVIGTDDPCLQQLNATLGTTQDALQPMDADEMQLMTHFIGEAAAQEFAMLDRAAANARLATTLCGFSEPGMSEDGLPFLMTPTAKVPKTIGYGNAPKALDVLTLCAKCGMEQRQSFGYPATSYMGLQDTGGTRFARISLGQDAPSAVVEKTYALGRLLNRPDDAPVDTARVAAMVGEDVRKALVAVLLGADAASLRQDLARLLGKRKPPATLDIPPGADLTVELTERLNLSLSEQLTLIGGSFAPAPLSVGESTRAFAEGGALAQPRVQWHQPAIPPGVNTGPGSEVPAEVQHLGSMVASLLRLATVMAEEGGETDTDRAQRLDLYQSLIDAGLPGVSTEGRRQAVLDWGALADKVVQWGTAPAMPADAFADRMQRYAALLPQESARAAMFCGMSPQCSSVLAPQRRESLVQQVFGGLSIGTQLDILETKLSSWDQRYRTCIDVAADSVKRALDGTRPLFQPRTLPTSGGTSPQPGLGRDMLQATQEKLAGWFLSASLTAASAIAAEAPETLRRRWETEDPDDAKRMQNFVEELAKVGGSMDTSARDALRNGFAAAATTLHDLAGALLDWGRQVQGFYDGNDYISPDAMKLLSTTLLNGCSADNTETIEAVIEYIKDAMSYAP